MDTSSLTAASKTSATVHAQLQDHVKTSTTHTLRFDQSLTTLMDHFAQMPPVVNEAGRGLESMASTGVTGMNLLGGAALVAAGAVATIIGDSISSYEHLGEQVENYRRVVGGSADESSRMVSVFNALGVGTDTATAAMFKLSTAIAQHPAKLLAVGIQTAKDTAGNVDLSKTLLDVADAYNRTSSQVERNAIVFAAFGKSGKDMIPILEQGSAALATLEKNAAMTFTDADLERIRETKVQTAELQQQWDSLGQSLGATFEPIKSGAISGLVRTMEAEKLLDQAVAAGTITAQQRAEGGGKLLASYEAQVDASHKVKYAIDLQTQALQDQAAAEDLLWTETDKVISQDEAQVNSGFALQQAQLAVAESQAKINQAQDAYDKAVTTYGASSDEALLAAGNVTRAQIDQEKSYYATAAAARKLQEDTDLATTGQKNASLDAKAYTDSLQAEANALAPDSPLRKQLQAYIDSLANLPRDITTSIHLQTIEQRLKSGTGYAAGGRPPVGPVFQVGEKGPEWMQLDSPATVYPNGTNPPSSAAVGANAPSMARVEALLRELITVATAEPSGQTGVEAALYRATQLSALNRSRGMAGA